MSSWWWLPIDTSKQAAKDSCPPNKMSPPPAHPVSCNLMHYGLSFLGGLFIAWGLMRALHSSTYKHPCFCQECHCRLLKIVCDLLHSTVVSLTLPAREVIMDRETNRRSSDLPGHWSLSSVLSVLCLLRSVSMCCTQELIGMEKKCVCIMDSFP